VNFNRISQMCPYLLGSSEGVMCSAAEDFIRNVREIRLEICMSRHFESCHDYLSKLKELSGVSETQNENVIFHKNITKHS
jgi:hypothetical protein